MESPFSKKPPVTPKSSVGVYLPAKTPSKPVAPAEQLKLAIYKELEVNEIGMGVLTDGTAYLTGRGLARLCAQHNQRIVELGQSWSTVSGLTMVERVKAILRDRDEMPDLPFIEIVQAGSDTKAYPEAVCMAVLEYYAFEQPNETAKRSYRILARKAFRDFVYTQVGYDPSNNIPEVWRIFHDRVSLAYPTVPAGYFSIFKEIADIIVHLGLCGVPIDASFVPDISVGVHWSRHWADSKLAATFGDRRRYEHNYPSYFPQAASNPQIPYCYPEAALGEFRRWVREVYVGAGKFDKYMLDQVKQKKLPASVAQLAIASYKTPSALP